MKTHSKLLNKWLSENPEAALEIAKCAVNGLWAGNGADPQGFDLDAAYPSGADYIDHVSVAIEDTGCLEEIQRIAENFN